MRIIIFGTGESVGKFLPKVQKTIEIIAFTDNNPSMWGKKYNNIKIINPDQLIELEYDYIVICSMFTKEIIEGLLRKGIKRDKIIPYYDNFYTKQDRDREEEVLKKMTKQIRNKKIALVSRGNSGCNCRALYKNIPDMIKKEFDVTLVSLEEYKKKWTEFEVAFTTHFEGRFYKSRLNIETWHGFPLKTIGALEKDCIDSWWDADKGIDYILSYSPVYSYIISSVDQIDINKFRVTGMPRNDFLANKDAKGLLGKIIPAVINKKLIIYAPTFRNRRGKESREGLNIFGSIDDFKIIDGYCKKNNVAFVIKKHILEDDAGCFNEQYKNLFLITDESLKKINVDFYQILGAGDILITDFSSVYFDYLLINKPVVFWIKDQQEYIQTRRLF